ncbi:hypothetical protein STRIP9103_02645 [Streptomyces ipomoeae 91-03]|uniref:Uncharacterized protein n=1 Tax=Streptomyces ipomoeae 91-03 TaxID=698759 RepID=L1KVX1_9ACTN|nr:hypothetical protein STRIP9103_02645 [Streptomyces ipomoeae 91-03]
MPAPGRPGTRSGALWGAANSQPLRYGSADVSEEHGLTCGYRRWFGVLRRRRGR